MTETIVGTSLNLLIKYCSRQCRDVTATPSQFESWNIFMPNYCYFLKQKKLTISRVFFFDLGFFSEMSSLKTNNIKLTIVTVTL